MFIDFTRDKKKKLKYVLLNIFGINSKTYKYIIALLGCDSTCQISELSEQQKKKLVFFLTNKAIISNELIKKNYENLIVLKKKNNYRNIRHIYKLPANGQNTHNNANTAKKKKSI